MLRYVKCTTAIAKIGEKATGEVLHLVRIDYLSVELNPPIGLLSNL